MSLVRALDHNYGRHVDSSPEVVVHEDEPSESGIPVNMTSETGTQYV